MKINETERKVLKALAISYDPDGFGYVNFKGIAQRSRRLTRKEIRRSCRSLARKFLAEYGKGLWTEDGEMYGSGYCCTKTGNEFIGTEPYHE